MRKIAAIMIFASFVITASPLQAEYAAPDAETLKKGELLYKHSCLKCHGEKGSGTESGPPLVHKIYHPNHHSDMSFRWAVQRGARSHHWTFGNMPKIDGVSDDEIEVLIKYIRNLQKEAGIF
ncbi:MAG: cytochrome c [Deltaproteobacteria bacterium]|nr:cytochrome c [Deltaproteobacteria bacterium]